MRKAWFVLGGFMVGVAATAFLSPRRPTMVDRSTPHLTLAERELDRIVPSIHLENVPFDHAVQDVRKLTRAPIIVDDAELAAVQFNRKTPITMIGNDVPLGEILSRLASSDGMGHFIGYQVFAGGIVITSATALGRNTMVRCYDVRDLIARQTMLDSDPDETRVFEAPPGGPPMPLLPPDQVRGQNLVELIEGVVSPESWRMNGGTRGAAYYFNGRLVVMQNWAGHREVRKVLAQLAAPDPPQFPIADQPWSDLRKEWVLVGTVRAQEALVRKPILHIDLDHLAFEAAIESLRRLSGATIWIDHLELPKDLTDAIPPISLHLTEAPLSQALDALILLPARDVRTGYIVQDGVVLITSLDRANHTAITRTFDVRDLIPAPGTTGRADAIDSFTLFVEDTVDPESWKDNGGVVGALHELNGRIIVTQTWRNQEAVAALLDALRKSGARFDRPMHDSRRSTTTPPVSR